MRKIIAFALTLAVSLMGNAAVFDVSGIFLPMAPILVYDEQGNQTHEMDEIAQPSLRDVGGQFEVKYGDYFNGVLNPPFNANNFSHISLDGSYLLSTSPVVLDVSMSPFSNLWEVTLDNLRLDIHNLVYQVLSFNPDVPHPQPIDARRDYSVDAVAVLSGDVTGCVADDILNPCTPALLEAAATLFQEYTIAAEVINFSTDFNTLSFSSGFDLLPKNQEHPFTAVNMHFFEPVTGSCSITDSCTPEASFVPIPAAAWLFLSAVGGLTGIRRLRATT